MAKPVLVTCFVTKNKIDRSEAYSYIPEGQKRPKYFTSERHFEFWKKKIDLENKEKLDMRIAHSKIKFAIGLDDNFKFPIYVNVILSRWNSKYTFEIISATVDVMKGEFDKIESRMSFNGIDHKFRYMLKVIENNLYKGKQELEKRKKQKVKEDRQSGNIDMITISNIENVQYKKVNNNNNGIGGFLDE